MEATTTIFLIAGIIFIAAINIKRFALHPQNKSVASEGREITPAETVSRRSAKQESPLI